jgi:RNA polymerase sigma factor (TIGR02999 family)
VTEPQEVDEQNKQDQRSASPSNEHHRELEKPDDASAIYQAVYEDLKRLARRQLSRESPFTDLPITVLVHESYARMAKLNMPSNRNAFFGYAARAMRSIIVDYVRSRQTTKRDAIEVSLTLAGDVAAITLDHTQIISVDRALVQLEAIDKRAHDLVELRYFAGFTLEECAEQLSISMATATRDWQKARAFLGVVLSSDAP